MYNNYMELTIDYRDEIQTETQKAIQEQQL